MRVKIGGYVYVHATLDVDVRDESAAFEEASGALYDGMRALLHVPSIDIDYEFENTGLDFEVL